MLNMDDTDDFTFCQVASQESNEPLDLLKSNINVGDISLKDEEVNDLIKNKVENSRKDGSSSNSYIQEKTEVVDGGSRPFVDDSAEVMVANKKPILRTKVPFEKGFSQMDWLKVTRTHPDLAGLKGQTNRRFISMNEVKEHNKDGAIWTILKGRVYNISPYMKFHPGGVDMLMKAAGKDCTSLFNKYHAWVNAEFLLEKCLVGILDESR